MEVLAWILLVVVALCLFHWWVEVYTPRKHWREAQQEADALMKRHCRRTK